MGRTNLKKSKVNETDIKMYDGTVVSGCFVLYKKTYKEKVIAKVNKMLNTILAVLILVSVIGYYFLTYSEMKLNHIRKETLTINDENLELQNHLDYLKSYTNVNESMKRSNLVQKAEQVVEVPAKEIAGEPSVEKDFLNPPEIKEQKIKEVSNIKWSLGY